MKFNKDPGLYKRVTDVNSIFIVGDFFSFTFDYFEIKNLSTSFGYMKFIDRRSFKSPLLEIVRGS